MDSSASSFPNQDHLPLLTLWHSMASGQPFDQCLTCQTPVLQNEVPYLIEKAIRNYPGTPVHDVLFEYAMCLPCAQQLREELSSDSRDRIDAFFQEKVDLDARREALLSLPDPLNLDHWISHCLVTGLTRETCTEYQIFGLCQNANLTLGYMPYMISGQAMEQMQALISAHTREILDDFMDTHFGLPPELRELLRDKLLLV